MIDTDMIASPNYARFVYDGDGTTSPAARRARRAPARSRSVFKRYFHRAGMATLPQAFDGRSDYVGFINRGIPAGGIFAGAEAPKTAGAGRAVRRRRRRAVRPVLPRGVRQHRHRHRPAAGGHDERRSPTDPALAQQQADALNGNALKSLREMSGAVTHAVWYFAQTRNALPPRDAAARMRAEKRTPAFKQLGHSAARLPDPSGAGGGARRPRAGGRYSPFAASSSAWRSSMRRILPVSVLGSSSTNSILRGYA